MSHATPTPAEARAALASVDATRAQLAAIANCPPWRHAAFGAVFGLLVTGVGFPPPLSFAFLAVALAGIGAIAASDRKRYGMFINGYRKGATRPFTFALLGVMLSLITAQVILIDNGASTATHVAIGAIAAVIATGASVTWSRIFRREMEGRA